MSDQEKPKKRVAKPRVKPAEVEFVVKQKRGNAGDRGAMGKAGEVGAIGSHTRTDAE